MLDLAFLPIATLWLAAGALLLAFEAFGAPGIGLAFGGLGALILGALIHFGVIAPDDWLLQWGLWFAFTAVFAALLWKPLQRWRTPKGPQQDFQNIIGDTAVIEGGDLIRGQTGHARWSGTRMLAEIDPIADATRIAAGEQVEIVHVKGITLYVRPRASRRPEEIL